MRPARKVLKYEPAQMTLDGLRSCDAPPVNEIEERYRKWKAEHPEIYALFERFALEFGSKQKRFGIKAIAERVRWEIETSWDGEDFKINNVYPSYVSRDLIRAHPWLAEFIELRRVRGECVTANVGEMEG